MNKLLIENYYKFMEKRTKYFKSPILNLDHYDFYQIGCFEKDDKEKTKDIINKVLEVYEINKGHVVWRIVLNGWGFPWVQIHYNKKLGA